MIRRASLPAVVLLLVVLAAGVASAHAKYVASSPTPCQIWPTPPTAVSVTLSEGIQPGTAGIRVTNEAGARFENGTAATAPGDPYTMSVRLKPLPPGTYTVAWVATSAFDGHGTSGSFVFVVQNADGSLPGPLPTTCATSSGAPVSPIEVVLRFAMFVGLVIAFGSALLAAFVWLPASRATAGEAEGTRPNGLRALLLWGRVGAFAFTIGAAGQWGLLWTADSGGSPLDLAGSPLAASLLARVGIGIALLATYSFLVGRAERDPPLHDRSPALLAVVGLGIAANLAGSWATHGAAANPWGPVGLLADALHLAGVTAWVGGLLVILVLRGLFLPQDDVPFARAAITRFSRFAFYGVGAVLLGGVTLALILIGTLDRLVGTAYGWVVLAKISLFAPMVAMGAYNRYRYIPAAETSDDPAPIKRLARNVRWEATLGATVLALAALLTALSPAAQPATASGPYVLQATSGTVRFDFEIDPPPGAPGPYTMSLLLTNATTGAGYDATRNGSLGFTRWDPREYTEQVVPLDGPHGNHFILDNVAVMSTPGTWRIDARVTALNNSTIAATFYVPLHG